MTVKSSNNHQSPIDSITYSTLTFSDPEDSKKAQEISINSICEFVQKLKISSDLDKLGWRSLCSINLKFNFTLSVLQEATTKALALPTAQKIKALIILCKLCTVSGLPSTYLSEAKSIALFMDEDKKSMTKSLLEISSIDVYDDSSAEDFETIYQAALNIPDEKLMNKTLNKIALSCMYSSPLALVNNKGKIFTKSEKIIGKIKNQPTKNKLLDTLSLRYLQFGMKDDSDRVLLLKSQK